MPDVILGRTHSLIYRVFSKEGRRIQIQFFNRLEQISALYRHKWESRNNGLDPRYCSESQDIVNQDIPCAQIIFIEIESIPVKDINVSGGKSIVVNIPKSSGYKNLESIIKKKLLDIGYNLY